MTIREALEIVLDAATEHWARDTSNQTLKEALQTVERFERMQQPTRHGHKGIFDRHCDQCIEDGT